MDNINIRSAKSIISKLDKRNDVEYLRISLYSVYVTILLSKELFRKNDDIKSFFEEINIKYRDYVYKSRTLIVARFIREIQRADEEGIYLYLNASKKVLFPNLKDKVKLPVKDSSSVDQLLRQFKRE